MAYKSKKQSKSNQTSAYTDSSFERSIGQLTSAVQTLTSQLQSNPTNTQKPTKPTKPRKPKVETPDMSAFESALGNTGSKIFKGIESVFGKASTKKLKQKMFDGFAGKAKDASFKGIGKNLLSGALGKAGGGFAGLAGGALKALGPISAVFDATKKVFDFINSGEAAQAAATFGAIFDVDTSKQTKELFESSKKYRDIIADFNIMTPVNLANQARMDGLEGAKAAEMDLLGWQQSKVKDLYEYETGLMRDRITFANDQAAQSLDANLSRNKTLFTNSMGYMRGAIGVSERALMAIGSSTQAVLDTVKNVGVTLGDSLRNQVAMATSAQGLGVLFGATADDVLTMSKTFRLMDKSTARQALNMVAGVKAYAKLNGMSPAQLHKEMADSQEEIFKYTNYTSMEYAKQVVQLKNMNTSMSSMMKASDAMVLNYKDSMKAEMSLGAMIGQNVDLSETRALLMSGKTSEAASAMKSALSGIDIGALNPFAKQELSQATGMNIDEIMNLMSGKEQKSKGQLEAENAAKTGAAIANGALKQDINNAAAKLALEQGQRKKLMEFEQVIRKNSLMIEQAQRLQNLAIEQKWRIKFAEAEKNNRLDLAIADMQKEAAANFFTNIFGQAKGIQAGDLKGTSGMKPEDVKNLLSGFEKERQILIATAKSGAIRADDPRLANYAVQYAKFDLSKNIKDFPKAADYFADSVKVMKEQVVSGKGGQGVPSLPKAKADVVKAEKFKEEKGGSWIKIKALFMASLKGGGMGLQSPAATDDVIKLATAHLADKKVEEAKTNLKITQNNLAELKHVSDLMDLEKKQVEDLKKTTVKDNILFYKQNELMLKYTGQLSDFMKSVAESQQAPIVLDGKTLNKGLLNQKNKVYGLGGTN